MNFSIIQVKRVVKKVPVIGPLLKGVNTALKRFTYKGSSDYWQSRYSGGGNSGPGSYGALADFKAEVLNRFLREKKITSVIELGCGDGNQLSLVNYQSYIGLDVSKTAIQHCSKRFKNDGGKSFFLYDPSCFEDTNHLFRADAALSLDVIYHLTEDNVFEQYMSHLFSAADKYVVIYSSNQEQPSSDSYILHRQFTKWIEAHQPDWKLLEKVPNRYPFQGNYYQESWADFYIFDRH